MGLPGEKGGLVPDPDWKDRRFGEPWYRGDTANFSIGQGYVLATPLQMARVLAAVVNGGMLPEPRLIDRITTGAGEHVDSPEGQPPTMLSFRRTTFETVVAGLRKAVEKDVVPTGTGYQAKVKGIDIVGKTGTAQVVAKKPSGEEPEEEDSIPYEFRDHAWFVAVAINREPRLVVCVLMEHCGHGGDVAAPAAGNLIRAIYTGEENLEPRVVVAADSAASTDG
jgi:penicillin-binding protein 2